MVPSSRTEETPRVDVISARVAQLRPGRVVLSGLARLLWLIGYLLGLLLALVRLVLWTAPAWCLIAVRLGVGDAMRPRPPFRRDN